MSGIPPPEPLELKLCNIINFIDPLKIVIFSVNILSEVISIADNSFTEHVNSSEVSFQFILCTCEIIMLAALLKAESVWCLS